MYHVPASFKCQQTNIQQNSCIAMGCWDEIGPQRKQVAPLYAWKDVAFVVQLPFLLLIAELDPVVQAHYFPISCLSNKHVLKA